MCRMIYLTYRKNRPEMKFSRAFTFILIMLFPSALFMYLLMSACTANDIDVKHNHELITITGKIRLVGNEPFPHLVITTDDGKDYLVQGDLEKELRAFQRLRVKVNGTKLPPKVNFFYCIEVEEYKIIYNAH